MNNYQWVIDNYQNRPHPIRVGLQKQSQPARTFERLQNFIVVGASCSLSIMIH